MLVRFGYVAMSTIVANASPSRTMTATNFIKLTDREAAVRKLERIAAENLRSTLRLLYHNIAHDIHVYRFSSRLIPLWGHDLLRDWNPLDRLADACAEVGKVVRANGMRVSFHPEHFTVLSTPREDVLRKSCEDLERHVRILEAMGLDERAKCNIHIGGTYGDREQAMARFIEQFQQLAPRIRERMTLENDDKTFTAAETLAACEQLGVPMVLDIHHHRVNNEGESMDSLWPRIAATWKTPAARHLPPKIHASSPKSDKDPRGHADYVHADDLLAFLTGIAPLTPRVDVMIEAKMKDEALFQLMRDLGGKPGVTAVDQASLDITPIAAEND